MKRSALTLLLLMATLLYNALLAQTTIVHTNDYSTRTTTYKVTGTQPGTNMFYMFDDGYFSFNTEPVHQYRKDDDFITTSYELVPYTVTPPTSRIHHIDYNGTGVPPGSATSALFMGNQTVRVGQSWDAATNFEMWLIVSFAYPPQAGGQPIDGTVKLFLDNNFNYLYDDYNSDWISSPGVNSPTLGQYSTKVEWDYSQLRPGEIRHVYAKVFVQPGPSNSLNVGTEFTGNFPGCDAGCDIEDHTVLMRKDKPIDPNKMTVEQPCLTSGTGNRQLLDYGVYYYNEGTGFAQNVFLDIQIDQNITANDITITNSSHPCTFTVNPTSGNLEITFPNIYLPGLNQASPHIYTWDQVNAFVEFSVCSESNLIPGQVITASTEIYFDSMPPVPTNIVYTYAEPHCPYGVICGFDGGVGVDESPIEERGALDQPGLEWQLYPNPVNDILVVEWDVTENFEGNYSLELMDVSGKIIPIRTNLNLITGVQQQSFSLAHLNPGMYILRLSSENVVETVKLIKQ